MRTFLSQIRTAPAAFMVGWRGLPPAMRGALWMLASSVLFVAMGVLVKQLGGRLHPFQVAFCRAAIGLMVMVPLVLHLRPASLKTKRPFLHLVRGVLGASAMLCGFYALTYLPLADATAISFSRALFLVPLAMLILGESIGRYRLGATIVGFIGVLIILRPSGTMEPAALVAVTHAVLVALAITCVKTLARTDHPMTLMLSSVLIGTFITGIPGLYYWQTPTWEETGLLVIMGLGGTLANNCFVRAYAEADAMAVAPLDYTRLLFATFAGFVFFGDLPDLWTIVGALIIVASTLFITYRETVRSREKQRREPQA